MILWTRTIASPTKGPNLESPLGGAPRVYQPDAAYHNDLKRSARKQYTVTTGRPTLMIIFWKTKAKILKIEVAQLRAMRKPHAKS